MLLHVCNKYRAIQGWQKIDGMKAVVSAHVRTAINDIDRLYHVQLGESTIFWFVTRDRFD
jgi:hypothetical protein